MNKTYFSEDGMASKWTVFDHKEIGLETFNFLGYPVLDGGVGVLLNEEKLYFPLKESFVCSS